MYANIVLFVHYRLPREKSKKKKKKKKRRLSDHTDDDLSEDYEPSHKKHKKELS